jgi:hypothetical protein
LSLGRGKGVQAAKKRDHQLMQGGEAQLHLRFDPDNPSEPEIGSSANAVLDQGCFTDAGLSPQDQGTAQPRPHIIQ